MQRQLNYTPVDLERSGKVRVALYGVGVIGAAVARAALNHKSLEVVGAVDRDPQKVGKDLGELIGGPALNFIEGFISNHINESQS